MSLPLLLLLCRLFFGCCCRCLLFAAPVMAGAQLQSLRCAWQGLWIAAAAIPLAAIVVAVVTAVAFDVAAV